MGYLNLRWPLRKERLFCRLRASDIYKKFQKFISICEILWANDGQIFHMGKKNGVTISCNSLILSVGAKGFEPSTPCSQSINFHFFHYISYLVFYLIISLSNICIYHQLYVFLHVF